MSFLQTIILIVGTVVCLRYTWDFEHGCLARSDELSLPSPLATFSTRNLTEAERGAKPRVATKFKKAILLDNGVTMNVNGPGDVSADRGASVSFV